MLLGGYDTAKAMTSATPPEYVLARSVLLDALQALGPHLDAVVLVGVQAVYLHTGDADLNVVPTTTDADLALFPAKLLDEPLLEDALRAAGFELAANPGAWRGASVSRWVSWSPRRSAAGAAGVRHGCRSTATAQRAVRPVSNQPWSTTRSTTSPRVLADVRFARLSLTVGSGASVAAMGAPTRWVTDTDDGHSQWYIERFRTMAAAGVDLGGEARLLDAMTPPGSRILDAGCGPGRVGAILHDRGHHVVGVDVDPELIAAAREDHPGPQWVVADLADLDLPAAGIREPFDAAVVAGNVLAFVAPGTEPDVLRRIAAHLVPGGVAVVGFGTTRGYALETFDADLSTAGFALEHRFATWDLKPWHDDAEFAVSVLRLPTSIDEEPSRRGEVAGRHDTPRLVLSSVDVG